MKAIVLLLAISLLSFSCDFVTEKNETEPSYTAKIAWDSGLISSYYQSHTVEGDSVYFYELPPGYNEPGIYNLTRIDAETGSFIWRSKIFYDIVLCQPIIVGDYAYVFLEPNIIVCFDRETGEHTAIAEVDIEGKDWRIESNVIFYKQYLYFGFWSNHGQYFVRLSISDIKHGVDPENIQTLTPEILWEVEPIGFVNVKPVVHNNIMYINTTQYYDLDLNLNPVQLAGFDINTKEMVYHQVFGGPEDGDVPFPETGGEKNAVLIHGDKLYYLSWSIAAWDLKTGKQLYRHVFTNDIPESLNYMPTPSQIQPVYYKNKIYYTSKSSYTPNSHRNIHCIDAATGKLVWNDIAKDSVTLSTNPIIAHDRLYITQHNGLRVYEPKTGKLIGVDKSFWGESMGRNVLYKDYMICVRENRNGDGIMVAVNVGK
jgi:outer membrane protein assembly factor BamB